jgi:hypothetical protein
VSDDGQTILRHQGILASNRANFDSYWEQVALRAAPASASFQTTTSEGVRRDDRIFDPTAIIALDRFAAFIGEGYTPRGQRWHGLKPEDDDLKDDKQSKEWFDAATNVLFSARYRPKANFTSQRQECYHSLGLTGNFAIFIDEDVGRGLLYHAMHMSEIFWAENSAGLVDLVYRRWKIQARQAAQFFGRKCPGKVLEALGRDPFQEFEFVHCVRPNEERIASRQDFRGMEYSSYFVFVPDASVVSAGGYRTFPYGIGRFMKGSKESYARSPAMTAYGSTLTVNEQKKTVLRAGQQVVEPPVLLEDEGALSPFNLRNGALNYGMLENGKEKAKAFNSSARVDIGIELMEMEKKDINDAFLISLFQILTDNPQMTATEVLARDREKADLLSPTTGRLEAEDVGPMVARELDILVRAGQLPPMPPQLAERAGAYKIEFNSPLARARRATDAQAIIRTAEASAIMVQLDPNARFVLKGVEAVREIGEINGVPAKLMRSIDEVQALAQAAQLAPGIAGAAKDVAQAQQIRSAA